MRNQTRKTKTNKLIQIILILLLAEKIIQHALTAIAFFFDIPGVGAPDIGARFDLSDPVMGVSNAVLVILFGGAIWGFAADKQWSRTLIFLLAAFDIAAEFVFHGFFFITFSVLGATILILLLLIYPVGNSLAA